MLGRQKVVLELLRSVGRPLSPTAFVKMTFLLRHETVLTEDTTFYDFVPYKYGPFSFALYRELDTLRKGGYVSRDQRNLTLHSSAQSAHTLRSGVSSGITEVVARYGKMRERQLIKTVYSRYPWYAMRSENRDLLPEDVPERPCSPKSVYTAGYEGKSIDRFLDDLLKAGIHAIVDVRANAASRKYGFSKTSFASIAAKLGLEYHHVPELGIPSQDRRGLDSDEAYERLLQHYERQIMARHVDRVERLAPLICERPSVLVCMEKDASRCHRGRLANALAKIVRLPIVHL